MSWAAELPTELTCRPTGLVVLTGLDVTYNAVHKAMWDCFCNNRRPDRVPLQFKVLHLDHEYPKCRSKRTSYEWYIPKGVLKTAWMRKHLELVPSVVVIFFDLDWDELLWKEKQMECATKVEIVRNSLLGRSTRVAVVLIQKNAPLPPGEDVVAAERAASLCSACDLSAKSLFVLPHTDHLLGYTIRLENAFYELAQSYYHTEARRVKAHKEFLNKTTHQLLYVRHQFKIAFYNELKQDTHTALKHYKQAYMHTLELRTHDTNLLEIKTIAGFINYKICRLSFQHNAPLDAIAQFRKHIDFFKNKVGIADLEFEHSSWMSKQFQLFGDLFDEAIKLGLTAIQTQHPGFYYQQAANHSVTRKQRCLMLCQNLGPYPAPDPLESLSSLDYYGQRPWRQGHQSIEPPDALRERDGVLALQTNESAVDHSWIIIPLLSSAVAQFKKYKSPRMKRYLMVQMGEEYYHARDYAKALTLLSRVTWDYRSERWWPLLTSIITTSLRCAYLTANVQEYVTLVLERMSKYIQCSDAEKTRSQMNLIRVMSNETPEPEPECREDCIDKAKALWLQDRAEKETGIFTIEMHNIVPFVECKAHFTEESFTADSHVHLKIFLRSSCQFPIRFSKLSVLLNNQVYNERCVVVDGAGLDAAEGDSETPEDADLYLVPGVIRKYAFSFLPQAEDVGRVLEITSVALELGSHAARCAVLHWPGAGGDAVAPPPSQQKHFKPSPPSSDEEVQWEVLPVHPVTRIEPRRSCMDMTVTHAPPSLVNEFYCVKVKVTNVENTPVDDVQLSFGLREGQEPLLETTTHVSVDRAEYDGKVTSRKIGLDLGRMEAQQTVERTLYVKNLQTGDRVLVSRVTYQVGVDVHAQNIECTCHKEVSTLLPVVSPFDVSVRLTSLQFERLDAVRAEEPFLLLTDLSCVSPWPIEIETSHLTLSPFMSFVDEDPQPQLDGLTLDTKDSASECCCLVAPPTIAPSAPMGTYSITWRRQGAGAGVPAVKTEQSLPTISIEQVPLYVDMDLPADGHIRQQFPITYNIYNRTSYSQEVEVSMEPSDAFVFAGHKQVHFRMLPHSRYQLRYAMFPLLPGNIPLPRMHLNMLRYPGTMDEVVQKMLQTHVYIKPSGKSGGFLPKEIESEA